MSIEINELKEMMSLLIQNDEKRARESEKRARESEKRIKEFDKKADKRSESADKRSKIADKRINKLEKMFIGMGLTQGSISEDIIADNFGNVFRKIGEEIDSIERNLKIYNKGRIKGEFDIIAVNGSKIFIGETKTKLTKEHIDKLVNISIPIFKKYDNRHAGMKVYGVVGARIFFNEEVKKYAIEKGLYVIKEKHNGNAEILEESIKGVKSF